MITDIVLNIPHSSLDLRTAQYQGEGSIEKAIKEWTDIGTDLIFRSDLPNVRPVIFPYNRFYCDCERLLNDTLNAKGNGIYYTEFGGIKRICDEYEAEQVYRLYLKHIDNVRSEIKNGTTLLIDCHSFPAQLADVDVCIGFNEDETKPDAQTTSTFIRHFQSYGYSVEINKPYSNSFSPHSEFHYKSIMIELNKRLYLLEGSSTECDPERIQSLNTIINKLYRLI